MNKSYIEKIVSHASRLGIRSQLDFFNYGMTTDPVENMLLFIKEIRNIDFSIFVDTYQDFGNIILPQINKIIISNEIFIIITGNTIHSRLPNGLKSSYTPKAIINLKTMKLTNLSLIYMLSDNSYQKDEDTMFYFLVGKEKFLISGQWVDRMGLEEKAFQYSTTETRVPFDLSDIYRIVTELGDLI